WRRRRRCYCRCRGWSGSSPAACGARPSATPAASCRGGRRRCPRSGRTSPRRPRPSSSSSTCTGASPTSSPATRPAPPGPTSTAAATASPVLPASPPSSHAIAIRRIIQTFVVSDKIRESMDWGRVRQKVVRVVRRLVHDTPELAGFLDLPGGMVKPHNVLPIGFGFRSKRHVRQQRRPRAYTIAQLYLEMKRCVPSSGQPDQGLSLDSSLRAGCESSEHHQWWYPLRSSEKKGVLDSIVLQTKFGNMTSPEKNYGFSSLTNAGTYMHSSQEDCHTENYCQGFIPRKHQREELAPEEDIDPKRQHTTLTFGEASLRRCAPERAPTGLRRVHYNLQTRRKLQPVAAACNPFAVRSIHQTPTPPSGALPGLPLRHRRLLAFGMNKRTCLVFHACDVSDLVDLVETTYRPVAEGGCATSGGSPRRSSRAPIEAMTRPRSIGRFIDQLMVRRLVHAHPRRRPPELLQSSTLTAASSSLATSSRQPRTWWTLPDGQGSSTMRYGWYDIIYGIALARCSGLVLGGDLARRVRRLDASRASPGPGRGGAQSRVGRRRRGRWRRSASERVNQWATRSASRRTESKTPTESMAPRASSPPAPGGGARARLSLEGRRERAPAAANAGQMWNAAWNDDAVASAPERGRRASLFAQDRRPPRVSLPSSPRPAAIARLVPNFRRFPPSSPIPAAIARMDDDDE
uniref:Uncharacterized protein n=1 Tax=Oryza glaberrima TaxID=4538 RepID=I1PPV5_ORYGL